MHFAGGLFVGGNGVSYAACPPPVMASAAATNYALAGPLLAAGGTAVTASAGAGVWNSQAS